MISPPAFEPAKPPKSDLPEEGIANQTQKLDPPNAESASSMLVTEDDTSISNRERIESIVPPPPATSPHVFKKMVHSYDAVHLMVRMGLDQLKGMVEAMKIPLQKKEKEAKKMHKSLTKYEAKLTNLQPKGVIGCVNALAISVDTQLKFEEQVEKQCINPLSQTLAILTAKYKEIVAECKQVLVGLAKLNKQRESCRKDCEKMLANLKDLKNQENAVAGDAGKQDKLNKKLVAAKDKAIEQFENYKYLTKSYNTQNEHYCNVDIPKIMARFEDMERDRVKSLQSVGLLFIKLQREKAQTETELLVQVGLDVFETKEATQDPHEIVKSMANSAVHKAEGSDTAFMPVEFDLPFTAEDIVFDKYAQS
mmetsp:Transcript_16125/g.31604  ORF Transcript_16125/g.31604 Transcript_16125/m.31604 type:complete len:365 (-) Transcript_16125:40-1134(-)